MVHAVGGNAVDGQDDVPDAHLGSGRFASVGELQRTSTLFSPAPQRVLCDSVEQL